MVSIPDTRGTFVEVQKPVGHFCERCDVALASGMPYVAKTELYMIIQCSGKMKEMCIMIVERFYSADEAEVLPAENVHAHDEIFDERRWIVF